MRSQTTIGDLVKLADGPVQKALTAMNWVNTRLFIGRLTLETIPRDTRYRKSIGRTWSAHAIGRVLFAVMALIEANI